ncbi:XRE family transcriptional regulator [bacterium]|nr:XRE family transcriptional regulator [bacterium]|tara:strand:- start:1999 stop:2472 length:474 start_codon:yes stop_codon:yes gene_type:complete
MNNPISIQELVDFLDEANKNTYANKDVEKAMSSRIESQDYHFESGNLIYHDTYFGSDKFIGGEIVYKDKQPVWGMNYYGFELDDNILDDKIGPFLKKALMQEYDNIIPVRGPKNFSAKDKEYRFSVNGDLKNFTGIEEISFNNKTVYRCFVHGGFIR